MVGVVEVDTDRSLRGRRPEAGPGPLGRPVGQGDAQIVLRTEQRSGLGGQHQSTGPGWRVEPSNLARDKSGLTSVQK